MDNRPLEDSDSVRSAKPLQHVKTVSLTEGFPLELGGALPQVTIAYETLGQLSPAKDNGVLICHALSGDSHVARHEENDDPGWWDIMVGPGKPIDTNRLFVICSNALGSCRGTTGPGSIDPESGKPYGADFPTITVGDMVNLQCRLLDHLGIQSLLAVVGGSLGGHQVLVWALRHSERTRGVVVLATSPRLTTQALAFDVVGRNAIRSDPNYHGGQYYQEGNGPEVGLALARMIGHITYLSREAMRKKFDFNRFQPRDVATEFEKRFSVGSYLGYQGEKFVERFDANSYLTLSMAMDLIDLGSTPQELIASFKPASCRWLVLSFSSDWLFPPEQSRDIVKALVANHIPVSFCNIQSACGHDAFLLPDELPSFGGMVAGFLKNLLPSPATATVESNEEPVSGHGPTSIFHQRRLDYDRILDLIPPGASVLDLGCGSGSLLTRLRSRDHRCLAGVELDEGKILNCVDRGLDVIQADLNDGLKAFADQQYDCVILSQTLQAVRDVEGIIGEMLRVGRRCIVSFPNLAYHKLRRMLAEEGRAPKSGGLLRYEWYASPNIRFFSIADFDDLCRHKGIVVHQRVALDTELGIEVEQDANLNADLAIFVLSRH